MGITLGLLAAAVVLALGFSVASLVIATRKAAPGTTEDLEARFNGLKLDVDDVHDRIEAWTRRDKVRRSRAAKSEPEAPEPPDDVELPQRTGIIPQDVVDRMRARR